MRTEKRPSKKNSEKENKKYPYKQKKRMKKEKKKKTEKILLIFAAGFGVLSLIFVCYFYMTGEHNSDIGHNILYLECEFDANILDLASDGNYYTGEELYILGGNQRRISFFLGLLSAFLFGATFYALMDKIQVVENK